jgi:hypothetical protein
MLRFILKRLALGFLLLILPSWARLNSPSLNIRIPSFKFQIIMIFPLNPSKSLDSDANPVRPALVHRAVCFNHQDRLYLPLSSCLSSNAAR